MIEKNKEFKPIELKLRFNEKIDKNSIHKNIIKITDYNKKIIQHSLEVGAEECVLNIKLYIKDEEISLKGYFLEFQNDLYSINGNKLDEIKKMKFFITENNVENNGNRIVKDGNFIYYSGNKKIYTYLQTNSYSEIWKTSIDDSIRIKLSNDFASTIWIDKEWIYYINYKGEHEENYLYRIKKDGTMRKKITDIGINEFKISDSYIFCSKYDYINIENNYKIFRIDKDGNNKVYFEKIKGTKLKVKGPFLYYINVEDNYSIYRVRLDGIENTKLNNLSSKMYMEVYNDWIYFINEEYNYNLYRMLKDGSYTEKLNNQICRQVIINNNNLYYYCLEEKEKATIYKMDMDGEHIEKILETDGIKEIFVKNQYIYYIGDRIEGIYKVKLDGSDNKLLIESNAVSIDVVGEYIYYYDLNIKDLSINLFRMKIDGTHNKIVK